jgi:hypothetical protein
LKTERFFKLKPKSIPEGKSLNQKLFFFNGNVSWDALGLIWSIFTFSYWSTGSEKLRKPPDLDSAWLGGFANLEEIKDTTPTSLSKEQAASQSTFIISHPPLISYG